MASRNSGGTKRRRPGRIVASVVAIILVVAIIVVFVLGSNFFGVFSGGNDEIQEDETYDEPDGGDGSNHGGVTVIPDPDIPASGNDGSDDGDGEDDADEESGGTSAGGAAGEDPADTPDGGEDGDETEDSDDPAAGDASEIANADLSVHFMELGNKYAGDSILIKCGDTEVLIDAGSRAASATTLKSYIDVYCTDGVLEYVIATHSDQDHISAFVGNSSGGTRTGILYSYEIGTIIMFDNMKSVTQTASNFIEATEYAAETYGTAVYTASQCYDETDGAQRQYFLDDEETVSINILYNYYYYHTDTSDNNNHSVVTLLTQDTEEGRLNYLFTGDLEEDGEKKLVEYYDDVPEGYDTEYNVLPEVELYKAGHHGSKTSSTPALMEKIKPKNVAVCCCCGSTEYTENDENTFPTQAMISNVCPYTENIYVTTLAVFDDDGSYTYTSMNGDIVFYTLNGTLKLWCSNNSAKLKDTEWFSLHRVWA